MATTDDIYALFEAMTPEARTARLAELERLRDTAIDNYARADPLSMQSLQYREEADVWNNQVLRLKSYMQ